MKVSKRKLDALKRDLKGNMSVLAEQCDVSVSTVSNVLNGVTNNRRVIASAIELRDLLKIELKVIEEKI